MRENADKMANNSDIAGLEKYRQGLIAQRDAADEGSMQFRLLNKEIERTLKLQQDLAGELIGDSLKPKKVDPVTGETTKTGGTTEKTLTPEQIRANAAKEALAALKQSYEEEKAIPGARSTRWDYKRGRISKRTHRLKNRQSPFLKKEALARTGHGHHIGRTKNSR